MKIYQVVLDTNVLVAGTRSKRGASYRLLNLLGDKRWQPNVCTALVTEYESVLKRQSRQLGLSHEDVDALVDKLCAAATHRPIYFSWRPLLTDSKDAPILDVAVSGKCDAIITFNAKHFRRAKDFDIAVMTPQDLLKAIGEIK